jgi:uncharacterized protein (TIGR00290 family)
MAAAKERLLVSWSGGKDSALALHEVRRSGEYEVAALLTTITEGTQRVGMHRVRRELIARQAEALGLPLCEVPLPPFPSNGVYEDRMRRVLEEYRARGVRTVVFGDLFLEDIRDYREKNLARLGMRGLYPIWRRSTDVLAREFVDLGFHAVLVCVDLRALDRSFVGRILDHALLDELPPTVDPCGENGEFHTFVFDGPGFAAAVGYVPGVLSEEMPFGFCDLLPA